MTHCPICGKRLDSGHHCSRADLRRREREIAREGEEGDEPSESERLADGFGMLGMDGSGIDNWGDDG